jgi:hypothetical protein
MLFPLTLYVCLLRLAWFYWRRCEALDRKDALYGVLLSIAVTWAAVLIALIPNQEYASAYGNYIIRLATILALGAGVVVVLVYLCWPTSITEAERQRAQDDLKVHYQNLIQRIEQWSYLHNEHGDEMICLATNDEKFGTGRSGAPDNLENDKKHLEKFKTTYDLYLKGKNLSREYKEKDAKTDRLFKANIRKRIEEKGMTIDEIEQIKLMWWLQIVIEGELRIVEIDGKLVTLRTVPSPDDTLPELFEIRNELKQRQDLRESIYDKLVVKGKLKDNEREFLSSLKDEVIERSKESNYSLPQLLNGVCDDCKHLK